MAWDGEERRSGDERAAVIEQRLRELEDCHKELTEKMDLIYTEMTKYKGFIGAVSFMLSGVLVCWNLFGDFIKDHWK